MKIFLLILFFNTFIVAQSSYFVSPTGSDSNRGSIKQPFKSLKRATTAVKAGDTIYMRAGVYPIHNRVSISGTENQPILFRPYKNEKVIFKGPYGEDKKYDTGRNVMGDTFLITGSWLIFKNLEFKNAATSIYLKENASYNRFENLSIHDNYYAGFTIADGASHNLIINCDSYNNFDSNSYGQHADGFVVVGRKANNKSYAGVGNSFINCRAWGNSDDGFDCWQAGNPVTFINCLAYKNGYDIWDSGEKFQGDGNGFKLGVHNRMGHARDAHLVLNCKAWKNHSRGFDYNDNEVATTLFRNIAWKNRGAGYKFGITTHNLIENIDINSGKNKISKSVYEDGNSWNREEYSVIDEIISFDDGSITSKRDANGEVKRDGFLELKKESLFFRERTSQRYDRLIKLMLTPIPQENNNK